MLASIHLLGERARGNRWGTTASAYLLGSVVGGVGAGTVLALAGYAVSLVEPPDGMTLMVLVVAGCLLAAGLDLEVVPVSLPTVHRQVNEDWLNRYRGWVYGAGFGLQLGFGVVTIVTSAAVYLTLGFSVLGGMAASHAGSAVLSGAVIGAMFGLFRALPVLVFRSGTTARLRATHRLMNKSARVATWATAGGLAGVAAAVWGRGFQ